ncbi:E3 ubiquitin-protein ligase rnf168-like isoform X2 [Eriocheir sinensis]|uniref:E3 ubiquitin-protein ligase rnf168-like isoform X2 n=1 Tax=Eriocheir sinensis TaxID=95602 RepID=UPI0021C8B40C|nr:E3 ubiquitin-protein ligase rnf168-like isoform X2 [Eriocheir sinensis]
MAGAKAGKADPAAAPSLEDVTCPICLSLLLEPVTLPCHHSLCLQCFQEHVSITSLACPMCRTRISVWVRKNTKTKTLVDAKLWRAIKNHFPAQLEARLAGLEDDSGIFSNLPQQRVSQPGEIRQEYETLIEQETQEARQRKTKEEVASIKLIQELQEEERKRREEEEQQQEHLALEDFLLAIELKRAESRSPQVVSKSKGAGASKTPTASQKGPMDLFLGQKGVSRGHRSQASASVLGSSDTNTILPGEPSSSPHLREATLKRFPSNGSESESDEASSRRQVAGGKENIIGQCHSSPSHSGESSKGRQACCDPQFSPDIDSFCVTTIRSPTRNKGSQGSSRALTDGDSASENEEEEPVQRSEISNNNPPEEDLSFLLKWESDKDSLAALLAEQKRAEAQLQQELQDRLLAEALQEELNTAKMVLRTKGSEDEYALRRRKRPSSPLQQQAGPSSRNSSKRQATLSEVLGKRSSSV